jgi:hypothetical protein
MNNWDIAAIVYGIIALLSLLPVLIPMIRGVKLNPGGATFDQAAHFSDAAKKRLTDHYSRILGTLGFWKKHSTIHTRFHYYCVCWTIVSSWLVPLLGTIGVQGSQQWLIVAVSSHVALALSFHRGLKIADKLRAFRLGESEFYDMHRRLLDRPHAFGKTQEEQLDSYFAATEEVRRRVRSAEADSMPNVEQGGGSPKTTE